MLIYWIGPATREFAGASEANPDPMVPGRFAIPADATEIQPPALTDKQAAVFIDGAWQVVADRRGETWYEGHAQPVMIRTLGDPAAQGLSEFEPPLPPTTVEELIAHANTAQMRKALGGLMVVVAGEPTAFSTEPVSMAFMNGKALRMQLPDPPEFINWQVGPTEFKSIAGDDFILAAMAVEAFVQSTFDMLPAVFSAIAAGTITTAAEIDAIFA